MSSKAGGPGSPCTGGFFAPLQLPVTAILVVPTDVLCGIMDLIVVVRRRAVSGIDGLLLVSELTLVNSQTAARHKQEKNHLVVGDRSES